MGEPTKARAQRFVDISTLTYSGLQLHGGKAYFGDANNVEIKTIRDFTYPGSSGTTRRISMVLHGGTHVDAPEHLVRYGKSIIDHPIEWFHGDAYVIDLPRIKTKTPGTVTLQDLQGMLDGKMQGIKMIIFRQGKDLSFQEQTMSGGERISLAPDCILWLAKQGVHLMNGTDLGGGATQIMLANGICNLHYAANLGALRKVFPERVTMMAMPLKISPAEASPVRAVVIEED